ncbi:MAG: CDP-diacylglycerol--serine O-phosphatidyltransferase [Bdellovibrionales bacterium RIFOXYD12_FULL_39_22]|nr:MAG: CDP-diacylglycerol--serine O-phosphatidyltransferase [Bdellovibrionales bacterium RIFOXYB1_FULL_39_21]OFZ41956.1 MAG: CDP-diacylglycerol--serine O-phosphatidyltransferase [Bdellovibrionales bacterium RIFOXYC12_FULL_39_17]OFZ50672.1 MAG: CDP-diacylglycerol--serine O-phosphatidyltransferase [Bdellovibrionales bacterium RIFOXYC1_FULL_39_130]OFZ74042.1 MAG: CDP-diacylglycerol--serine O-phosphatidyltransferase [Bdellovibrionales bacterium RIFOXYC2_FULL_39_8]OFZ77895.1 MAG: CDP-diacylglycerol
MFDPKKLAFFLPNTFTALNIACGFASVIYSFQYKFEQAALILLLGALFDSVDGRIARLTGTQSPFGEQFDSLSDVISFGVAPAMLVYQKFLINLGRPGLVVAFIYLLCGALRLARFNANIKKINPSFFQGLPIPGGAMAMIGLVLFAEEFEIINDFTPAIFLYILAYSLLMISNIWFYSFKKSEWLSRHKKTLLFSIFILFSVLYTSYEYAIFVFINIYTVGSLYYFMRNKGRLEDVFEWSHESDSEGENDNVVESQK